MPKEDDAYDALVDESAEEVRRITSLRPDVDPNSVVLVLVLFQLNLLNSKLRELLNGVE